MKGILNRTVPKFMYFAQGTKFSWHKSLTCRECAQLSPVSMKHVQSGSSCTIVSSFVTICHWQKENKKHPIYDIFSVISVLVRSRTKLTHYGQKKTCKWHPSATCLECLQIDIVRYRSSYYTPRPYVHTARKRKTWQKAHFRVFCISSKKTSK